MITRILIVDDHHMFREGLASLFRNQPDFTVAGEAGSVAEAVALARELQPDLVLMDFSLPDGTGLDATAAILAERPNTNIVFLTMYEEDDRLFAAIRSGAKGYLLKNLPVSKLMVSLRAMSQGEAPLSRKMATRLMEEFSRLDQSAPHQAGIDLLTAREREIYDLVVIGATNGEIAARLFISENTVKNHVHSILEKLKLENRRELVSTARNNGRK